MYNIYEIKNLVNSKRYIGCSKNIDKRFKEHLNKLNKNYHENKYLQDSWNKYGNDSFEFNIIETLNSEEDMFNKEIELISTEKNLYNIAEGGHGGNTTKNYTIDQKEILSKKLSEIRKEYCKKNGTLINNPFLNKTEEERKVLIQKWSDCKKGIKNSFAKYPNKIAQIKNGEIVKIWNNIYEASDAGFRRLYMIKCAKNEYPGFKTHKGYEWKFID